MKLYYFESVAYVYACFGRELLYANPAQINQEDYQNLKLDYKDDMFSLGVTLFILITGHYPTCTFSDGIAFDKYKYMNVREAYNTYPRYKELLAGLFILDRDKRFSAQDASNAYNRIRKPVETAASNATLAAP